MGALVYEPAFPAEDVDEIDVDALSREALDVLAGHEGDDVLTILEELGESSGGARPKVLVAIDAGGNLRAGTDAMPSGYDAWIVKFRAPRDRPDAGPLEAAYADMARAAGIDVAETTLLPSRKHDLGYFATKRFDRGPAGERYHALSVAGSLEAQWEIPSIDYHGLLNATRYVTRRQADVEQMFRRMLFNFAAHNRDDHAKQHAFLMDATGTWRLAPAYDLNFSSGPAGEHYLTVNGRGTAITGGDITAVAARHNISAATARAIVDEVLAAVADFDHIAARYDVPGSSRAEIATVLTGHERELRALTSPSSARPRKAAKPRSG
jgi:serine/threonine-protein kinase HipA